MSINLSLFLPSLPRTPLQGRQHRAECGVCYRIVRVLAPSTKGILSPLPLTLPHRADNIVRDAEQVRKTLVPSDAYAGRWSIIGQSFGGFCAVSYLSMYPNSLIEVMITGGIPPDVTQRCSADAVYRALYRRDILQVSGRVWGQVWEGGWSPGGRSACQ